MPLPREIEVRDQGPAGVRYVLPRRSLGKGKYLAWLMLLGGGLVFFSVTWLVVNLVSQRQLNLPCILMPALLVGLYTWCGITPMWWGLAAMFGHRELELQDGYLRTIERVGPFWRSQRWRAEEIACIEVKTARPAKSDSAPTLQAFIEAFNSLAMHGESKRHCTLAWGYSHDLLLELANEIAPRAERMVAARQLALPTSSEPFRIEVRVDPARSSSGTSELSAADDVSGDFDDDDDDDLPVPRPAHSNVEVNTFDDGITIRVPALGIRKGAGGLFWFSIVWCGFMVVFDSIAVAAMLNGQPGDADGAFGLLLFSVLFWLVGIGMLLTSLNMGRRRAAIALAGGQLTAIQSGLFGTKSRAWEAADVQNVLAMPSGVVVNNRPLYELRITGIDNQDFKMLGGRHDEELFWLAWLLREELGLRGKAVCAAAREDTAETDL